MSIVSVDPRNGEVIERFSPLDDEAIEEKLARAESAFEKWRRTSFAERAEPMRRAAALLEDEASVFGRLMTEEMGKPIEAAVAEAKKCASVCRHYAEHAQRILADEPIATEAASSFVRYLPLGPVLAVMPWNFPFWQVLRFAAPGLMAGNVGLLKHASNVPRCALALERLFLRAGFPEGVFQTLLIGADAVPRVLADRRVAAATLTGSTSAGASVAMQAGKLVKPTVLELGGSDAFIVMPSADLDVAVRTAVAARILNNGQSCINAKRFIVHRAIYDPFEQRLVAAFKALEVGDPMDPKTRVGPLALASVRDDVASQVERSVRAGARRLTGAVRIERPGFWFQPGVLSAIPEDAPAFSEELFGPVALLFSVDGIEDAIRLANRSRFGLGSSAWTREPSEQARFIDELEAGQTFINAMVASDPRLPFGGIKQSGYGRELGVPGIRAFVNAKTAYVAASTTGDHAKSE
jgi:succinate-semialdehyde dehydrogenase / glutarate-semialdehyde dehydrogenase